MKHQIDVQIERGGEKRRILVECKDFDVAGDKVGLDIVRSFRSVVEDTEADEALILTCNGFTKDARKYAKAAEHVIRHVRRRTPVLQTGADPEGEGLTSGVRYFATSARRGGFSEADHGSGNDHGRVPPATAGVLCSLHDGPLLSGRADVSADHR